MRQLAWAVGLSLLTSACTTTRHGSAAPFDGGADAPAPATTTSTGSATGFEADAYLQPVNPFELRLRPKVYAGDFTIVAIAADGSHVKAGDVLLQLDSDALSRQLAAAKNDLLVAQSNLAKLEASATLSEQSDVLALHQQADQTRAADDAVTWWNNVDGPNMLEQADLTLQQAQAQVDDQQDELDQLRKMYKSEELTNATADIVTKRAIRALEVGKKQLAMTELAVKKSKEFDYPREKQKPLDAQSAAHIALEQLKVTQAQAEVARKTDLVAANAAVDDAQRKVNDLTADLAGMTVLAPADGVVAYGNFAAGAFASDPRALRIGEKVPAGQVLLTVYTPGNLSVHLDLPEEKFVQLHAGQMLTVEPTAFAGLSWHGILSGSRTPTAGAAGPIYSETLSLEHVDPRLVPGSKVKVFSDASATSVPN